MRCWNEFSMTRIVIKFVVKVLRGSLLIYRCKNWDPETSSGWQTLWWKFVVKVLRGLLLIYRSKNWDPETSSGWQTLWWKFVVKVCEKVFWKLLVIYWSKIIEILKRVQDDKRCGERLWWKFWEVRYLYIGVRIEILKRVQDDKRCGERLWWKIVVKV